MPQALIVFVGSIAQGIVTGLTAIGFSQAAAVGILNFGIQLAAVQFLGTIYDALVGSPDRSPANEAATVTTRETLGHQRIVYGETLVSGPIWYMNAAGNSNQALHYGIILAGHECEDIVDVWLDDKEIPGASIDWDGSISGVTGTVMSGDFRGAAGFNEVCYFFRNLGAAGQVVDNTMNGAFTEINSSHRGQGICHGVARLDYFTDQAQVWSAGAPNNIKWLVRGKKVYDPRSDSTQSFGTGPHRLTNSLSWEFSRNGALHLADYMIDKHLGFGEDTSRIDYGYVASAAGICDGIVYTPVGTDVRFSTDGQLSAGDSYETNINRLLSSFNGTMPNVNGVWKMRAWGYEAPTLSYDEDNAAGDIQIKLTQEEDERYNTVRAFFVDRDRLWKGSQAPDFSSSEYVSRDNDEVINKDIQLHMTKDVYMAQRLAAGILEQSDLASTIIYPTNYKTLPAELGGTINVSINKFNWDPKVFRVMRYKLSDMSGINLVAREDRVSAYVDVASNEYTVASNGSYVVSDIDTPPPSSLWVTGRADGYLVNVSPPAARLYETIKIYASVTSAFADANEIANIKNDSFLHLVERPTAYYYFARAIDFTGGESIKIPNSDYSNVIGRPGLLSGVKDLTFDLSSDIDTFYDVQLNSCFIVIGDGENGEDALGMVKIGTSNAGAAIRTKQYYPILGDTLRISTRYRVNSNYGGSPNSVSLAFRAYGYHPTPVNSVDPKFQSTEPGSYTQVVAGADVRVYTNSLTMDGSWYTVSADVDAKALLDAGATLFRPGMAWSASNGIAISTSVNARHNNFVFHWK